MNKKLVLAASLALLALPLATMAFTPGNLPNVITTLSINGLIDIFFNILWPIFIAFAIVMFILGGVKFFNAEGDPDKVVEARNTVLWGIVGLAVAFLAFSIPWIVRNTLTSNGGPQLGAVAPAISNESTSVITSTSLTATWTTANPETSRVVYDTVTHPTLGSAPNYGYAFSTTEDPTMVTNHSVTISGLSAGTTYFYRDISHGSPEVVGSEQAAVTLGGGDAALPGGGVLHIQQIGPYNFSGVQILYTSLSGPTSFTNNSTFDFGGGGLSNGSFGLTSASLTPGSYSIAATTLPNNVKLDGIICGVKHSGSTVSSSIGTSSLPTASINFSIIAGDTVDCMFFYQNILSSSSCIATPENSAYSNIAMYKSVAEEWCNVNNMSGLIVNWCQSSSTFPSAGPNFNALSSSVEPGFPDFCPNLLSIYNNSYASTYNQLQSSCTSSQLTSLWNYGCNGT